MSLPLIIVGAGASYDFLDPNHYSPDAQKNLNKWRPPLANDIFVPNRFYDPFIKKYPHVSDLAGSVIRSLERGENSFEKILTEIKNVSAEGNPERHKQLVDLRYYLADLFYKVTSEYFEKLNNYQELIQKINDAGIDGAYFVNFNYDLLLERYLDLDRVQNINEYIQGKYKIIKIHGCYKWYYARNINASDEEKTSREWCLTGAKSINRNEDLSKLPIVFFDTPDSGSIQPKDIDPFTKTVYLPAVALPLQDKDNFVCPSQHLEVLRKSIEQIDKIIIIGWRGADPFLIEFLNKEFVGKKVFIAIITSEGQESTIRSNLGPLAQNISLFYDAGFTAFMKSDQLERFLKISSKPVSVGTG